MRFADHFAADPRARAFATRWAPGRWIARRRARALFGLMTGFVGSQVLLAAIRFRLPELLRDGDRDLAGIAASLELAPERARALLDAATALKLARRVSPGRYALGPLGAVLIGEPGLLAMIEHHRLLYADLADPVALFRGAGDPGHLRRFWPYAEPARAGAAADAAAYSTLMALTVSTLADAAFAAPDIARSRVILDIGGGDGSFLLACGRRAPAAELVLFDLAPVAARAEARFAASELAGRARVVGGDLRRDPIPSGADLVTLVRVLHDHPDIDAIRLLRRVHEACRPGTVLLVAEPMAGTDHDVDAYFAIYLLAIGRGRLRTVEELRELLAAAGWCDVREHPTPMPMLARVLTSSH